MLPAKSMSKLLLVIDSRLNGFAVSVLFVVKYNDVSNIVYSHKRTLVLFLLLLLLFLLYKLYQLKNNARNLLKNAQTKARCHGRMDCERPPHWNVVWAQTDAEKKISLYRHLEWQRCNELISTKNSRASVFITPRVSNAIRIEMWVEAIKQLIRCRTCQLLKVTNHRRRVVTWSRCKRLTVKICPMVTSKTETDYR